MEELTPSPTWHDSARVAMGQTRRFADRINLAEMPPHDALADGKGPFSTEWSDVSSGKTVPGAPVEGGGRGLLDLPCGAGFSLRPILIGLLAPADAQRLCAGPVVMAP
jgi:hypothetical protein